MNNYILLNEIVEKKEPRIWTCMQCGSCSSVCHAAHTKSGEGPEEITRLILFGHDEEALNSTWIWRCSLCGRCKHHCPMGIDIPGIITFLRTCQKGHLAPIEIRDFFHRTLTSGNVLSLTPFEVIKTLQWIEQELRRTSGKNHYRVPIDEVGADLVVFVSSRDLKFNPRTILALSHLMNYAKVNWTIPSYGFEEANFGAILGDTQGEKTIAMQKIQTMHNLGAHGMLIDSCDHAFTVPEIGPGPLRKIEPDFWVTSTVLLMWSLMEKGLSPPKKATKSCLIDKVFISDPCGVTADSASYKAIRNIFDGLGVEPITLEPAPPTPICCGGGAATGLLPLETRKELTRAKAQQLSALPPGAIVTTYCRQCGDMLREIVHQYKLSIQFIGIHELLYELMS